MDIKDFALRVAQLRTQKGVSARDMSLSMGQNPGYITNIESCHSKPSIDGIFAICEYLGVTPTQFFDTDSKDPTRLDQIVKDLKHLDAKQLEIVSNVVSQMINK